MEAADDQPEDGLPLLQRWANEGSWGLCAECGVAPLIVQVGPHYWACCRSDHSRWHLGVKLADGWDTQPDPERVAAERRLEGVPITAEWIQTPPHESYDTED